MEVQELKDSIKPIMQAMLLDITKNQPQNPVLNLFILLNNRLYL